MRRLALVALLGALFWSSHPVMPASAHDPDAAPSARQVAWRIATDEAAMADALGRASALTAQPAGGLLDSLRTQMAIESAAHDYRVSVRDEEIEVYRIAAYGDLESAVVPMLPQRLASSIENSIAALHAIYSLAGIDEYYLVFPHFTHPYADAESPDRLRADYTEAQRRYGVDASYLASINYIESNFGRVNGPSSAGAEGPMQFIPSTWDNYGQGGDIMSPHDSIIAAARYLAHYGAPGNMRQAIYHYNLDYDYVDAVEFFARAFRNDPTWFDRMYYWNTAG